MEQTLNGLVIDAEMPYFACFRKPTSTSIVMTYPLPPFTTIIGMLANALGVTRANYFEDINHLQEELWLNLRPLTKPELPSIELVKILKLTQEEKETENIERAKPTSFPSSPMFKYFLTRSSFRFFVASPNKETIDKIEIALKSPFRPLYLGQSDDMVIVNVNWKGEVKQIETKEAWALIKGAHEGNEAVEILKLPIAFKGEDKLFYSPLLTLPSRFPFKLSSPQILWNFNDETVHLFNGREEIDNSVRKEC